MRKKINISLSEKYLAAIDQAAKSLGKDRSKYLRLCHDHCIDCEKFLDENIHLINSKKMELIE